jgi:tetratricopeptide (TPR) repeat protein
MPPEMDGLLKDRSDFSSWKPRFYLFLRPIKKYAHTMIILKYGGMGLRIIPILLGLAACTSMPYIPENLSPAELIQKGQEASDRNRYKQSLQYYEAILERYPSYIDEVCAAEYEIAFIHYKQKQYELAKSEFHALLSRYETPDAELLPLQFKKLTEIVLAKIAAKER